MAVVTDDFNRANGALGTNWTSPAGGVGANGTLLIASNQVKAQTDDTHSFAIWSANAFESDQYAQITLGSGSGQNWMGICLRVEIGVQRFYVGFPWSPNQYMIYRFWDGAFTQLATATDVAWGIGDVIKMDVTGSVHPVTVRLYRNGVQKVTWTTPDATYVKAGGSAGMGLYSPAGWNLRIDNFEAGGATPNIPPGLTSASLGMLGQYQKHFA